MRQQVRRIDRRREHERERERGQSMVEFALVVPLLVLLLLAVIDIGQLLSSQDSVMYASRQGARLMGAYGSAPPPGSSATNPDTLILNTITETLRGDNMDLNNLQQVTLFKDDGSTPVQACVYTFNNGTPSPDPKATPAADGSLPCGTYGYPRRNNGDYIGVSITYHYPGLTSFYAGGATFADTTHTRINPQTGNGYDIPTPVPVPTFAPTNTATSIFPTPTAIPG